MTYSPDELDDMIEDWHIGVTKHDVLWEHLGWTHDQYKHWIETGEQP